MLVEYIVAKFQSKRTNPNGAQVVFTTHDTELLNMELLRKDQLYFVDKGRENGVSELYSIGDFIPEPQIISVKDICLGSMAQLRMLK